MFYKLIFITLGLFDKAKKKFLGDKEVEVAVESGQSGTNSILTKSTSLYDVDYWQPQDIGRQHWLNYYKHPAD